MGDQNSAFFNKSFCSSYNSNMIANILSDSGVVMDKRDMKVAFVSYYKQLLGMATPISSKE